MALSNDPVLGAGKNIATEEMLTKRKLDWPADDERRKEEARILKIDPASTYFGHYESTGDEIEEDMARLFEKILRTFDFESHCPVLNGKDIINALVGEAKTYGNLLQDPSPLDTKTLGQGDLRFWRGRVTLRRKQLLLSLKRLEDDVADWADLPGISAKFRAVVKGIYRDMVEGMYLCRFFSGEDLEKELEARRAFYADRIAPPLSLAKLSFQDNNAPLPLLFEDYDTGLSGPNRVNPRPSAPPLDDTRTPRQLPPQFDPVQEYPKKEGPTPISHNLPPSTRSEDSSSTVTPSTLPVGLAGLPPPMGVPRSTPATSRYYSPSTHLSDSSGGPPPSSVTGAAFNVQATTQPFNRGLENPPDRFGDAAALSAEMVPYDAVPSQTSMTLPTFYGNHSEFPGFWQLFTYLVDRNPRIPVIVKLHQLKKALKGKAEYLAAQVEYLPEDYPTLKKNILLAYSDDSAAFSELSERMREWPRLKEGQFQPLASLAGFARHYVNKVKLLDNGECYAPRNVIRDLTAKFYPRLREDFRRDLETRQERNPGMTKEDELAWLLTWLDKRVIIAREEERLNPSHVPAQRGLPGALNGERQHRSQHQTQQPMKKPKKKMPATATTFCAEGEEAAFPLKTDKKPKAQKNGGGKDTGPKPGGGSKPKGDAGAGRPRKPPPTTTKGGDSYPCLFCKQVGHPARNCPMKMKPKTIYIKAEAFALCINCLRAGHP